jgi:hypothetical protein
MDTKVYLMEPLVRKADAWNLFEAVRKKFTGGNRDNRGKGPSLSFSYSLFPLFPPVQKNVTGGNGGNREKGSVRQIGTWQDHARYAVGQFFDIEIDY